MPNKNEIKDELKDLAPMLGQLKARPNHQELPDGYFDSLEQRLSTKLLHEKPTKTRMRRLWSYSGIAVAASIALFFLTRNPVVNTENPVIEALSSEEALVMDQFDVLELEYYLAWDEEQESLDVESLLLEEDNLEELLNI